MEISTSTANDSPVDSAPIPPACECLWSCGRGPTRLCCHLCHNAAAGGLEVEVVRNGRSYGSFHFVERFAAITFASQLRLTFEGNGWMAA